MSGIERELCEKIRCPFLAKGDVDDREGTIIPKGTCLQAYIRRRSKQEICRVNPLIEVKVAKR